MSKQIWSANETQKAFLAEVAKNPNGITLFELKLQGKDFKSGSVNVLVSKGLVTVDGDREFECDIVFNGTVVGKTTKTGKVFKIKEQN